MKLQSFRAVFVPALVLVGTVVWLRREKPPLDSRETTEKPAKRVRENLYEAVELSPEQLQAELRSQCEQAVAASRPVLLEFSAPWCEDCLRLQAMKKEPVLEQAMQKTQFVTINVGDFDRHEVLVQAFDIRAIARWQLLAPDDCSQPVGSWKRLAGRTLEPETGTAVNAQQLAHWLEQSLGPRAY